jgi:HlyD family secretion protein
VKVVTGAGPNGPRPSRWARLRALGRGATPRRRWLNIALAVLLVLLAVVAVRTVGTPEAPTEVARTASVSRGTVTAMVSSTGNTEESLTTEANFENEGTITAINVKAGDTVEVGQVLATIDPTSARNDLRSAQADRDNAQAAYDQARAGPTDVKKRQDQAAIDQAEQGVDNAETALANARDQLDLDETSSATEIDNAEQQLANTRRTQDDLVDDAEENLDLCRAGESTSTSTATGSTATSSTATITSSPSTTTSSPSTTTTAPSTTSSPTTTPTTTTTAASTRGAAFTDAADPVVVDGRYTGGARTETVSGSSDEPDCTSQEQAVNSAKNTRTSSVDEAEQNVTTAEQNRDSTLQADRKAIDDAEANLATARGEVTDAELTAEANLRPKTDDEIAQALATLNGRRVDVDKAQVAVGQTELKAPAAGVVLGVNGEVGGSSSSSSSTTGTSSTDGSSTGSSAFITLGNLSRLAVTADVDEAEAARLQVGQVTDVTFAATGTTATGTITEISPQATVADNVVRFPVTVLLETAPEAAKVGETANVSVVTGRAESVLLVPSAAITNLPTGTTVTVRRDGTDVVVPVRTGLVGETDTEIVSGLREGDTVVLPAASGNTTTVGPGGGG